MIELENHDRRVRGEPPRPPRTDRPRPTKKPPTARCTPWEDAHFIQGELVNFQILLLTGSMCDRALPHIYTTDQLHREVKRGLHPMTIMYMQKVSYICRLFHVIQCEVMKDWSFKIGGEDPSWDDHAFALEEMYSKMVTDSGFFEYASPGLLDVRALLRMEAKDEPTGEIDPYLWDQIYDHYWSFPTTEFVKRPTLVIADSCLNHGGKQGASNLAGYMKQYSRKHFEFGLNSGGDASAIARSIILNGKTHWNTR
eukprot:4987552-Amphidinium_carterae.1